MDQQRYQPTAHKEIDVDALGNYHVNRVDELERMVKSLSDSFKAFKDKKNELDTKRIDGPVPTSKLDSPSTSTTNHPFRVRKASATQVIVVFGQVNSITPTISGVALNNSTAPKLTISTNGVVYLECSVDGSGNITAVAVKNAASLPSATSSYAYITLASIALSGGSISSISQSVTASLQCAKCGTTTYYFGAV